MSPGKQRNIEEHLTYSHRLHGMAVSHQNELMPLLETIEQLQDDLRATSDALQAAEIEIADKDSQIAALQAELDALRSKQTQLFCRITKAAYDMGVAQKVEDELRSAIVSAPKLLKAIRTNEALGYLDTKNLSSKELFDLLDEHFHLPFKYRQFAAARSF